MTACQHEWSSVECAPVDPIMGFSFMNGGTIRTDTCLKCGVTHLVIYKLSGARTVQKRFDLTSLEIK